MTTTEKPEWAVVGTEMMEIRGVPCGVVVVTRVLAKYVETMSKTKDASVQKWDFKGHRYPRPKNSYFGNSGSIVRVTPELEAKLEKGKETRILDQALDEVSKLIRDGHLRASLTNIKAALAALKELLAQTKDFHHKSSSSE
jgi:hypothetical protein